MISFSKVDMMCERGDKLQVLNEERTYLLYDQCHQAAKKANNKTVINFAFVRANFVLVRMQTASNRTLTAAFDAVFVDTPSSWPIAASSTSASSLRQQPAAAAAVVASAPALAAPTQRTPFVMPPTTTTKITKALSHGNFEI